MEETDPGCGYVRQSWGPEYASPEHQGGWAGGSSSRSRALCPPSLWLQVGHRSAKAKGAGLSLPGRVKVNGDTASAPVGLGRGPGEARPRPTVTCQDCPPAACHLWRPTCFPFVLSSLKTHCSLLKMPPELEFKASSLRTAHSGCGPLM